MNAARVCAVALLLWTGVSAAKASALVDPTPAAVSLTVPLVRQQRERCGPAALEMVLRFYAADAAVLHEGEKAFDPVLRGTLITDLAAAARRAGFDAELGTSSPEALVAALASGVPPIVLYQSGRMPLTVQHFGVVTAWNPEQGTFTINDGTDEARTMPRSEFGRRWRTAGAQALFVRRRLP